MPISIYIKSLTGQIFKILPIKEQELYNDNTNFQKYLETLALEMTGACTTFPCLVTNSDYMAILNTVNGLSVKDCDLSYVKKETFKMMRLINRIEEQCGGDIHVG